MKSTPPLERHKNCECEIVRCKTAVHYAKIHCVEHNVVVCWLSRQQYNIAVEQGLVKQENNSLSKLFESER